jgi:RNA polymerase sigma-70 factor (ECF subfamily)
MSKNDDLKAVEKTLRGNIRAFETLVAKYQKPIFNGAFRMLNQYEDAEDVTQSVFMKAYENLNRFDPQYKFFSWLYRILMNETFNLLNQRRRHSELDADSMPEIQDRHEYQGAIELEKDIQEALMDLKPDYRSVIVLNHFQNFSYTEMSNILEIPEKTVKSRLFTARHILKDILMRKGFVTS